MKEWEADSVWGELLHTHTLMFIHTDYPIHPQFAGAQEVGHVAKILQSALMPTMPSWGRICSSPLGNPPPEEGSLAEGSTSDSLLWMARPCAPASLLAMGKSRWDSAPSPVSRERGALGKAGLAAALCTQLPPSLFQERHVCAEHFQPFCAPLAQHGCCGSWNLDWQDCGYPSACHPHHPNPYTPF